MFLVRNRVSSRIAAREEDAPLVEKTTQFESPRMRGATPAGSLPTARTTCEEDQQKKPNHKSKERTLTSPG